MYECSFMELLEKLGATSKYKGYYYVVDAVEMAQKNFMSDR